LTRLANLYHFGSITATALCNGPSCAELQGDWIVGLMKHMREKNLAVVNAELVDEAAWAELVWTLANASLLPSTKSVCDLLVTSVEKHRRLTGP